jgi:hypothetical protein
MEILMARGWTPAGTSERVEARELFEEVAVGFLTADC